MCANFGFGFKVSIWRGTRITVSAKMEALDPITEHETSDLDAPRNGELLYILVIQLQSCILHCDGLILTWRDSNVDCCKICGCIQFSFIDLWSWILDIFGLRNQHYIACDLRNMLWLEICVIWSFNLCSKHIFGYLVAENFGSWNITDGWKFNASVKSEIGRCWNDLVLVLHWEEDLRAF